MKREEGQATELRLSVLSSAESPSSGGQLGASGFLRQNSVSLTTPPSVSCAFTTGAMAAERQSRPTAANNGCAIVGFESWVPFLLRDSRLA